jgi:hypothetical protein
VRNWTAGHIAIVLCSFVNPPSLYAGTLTPQQQSVVNNLQEEYTACGYYYRVQIACTPLEGREALKLQLDPILRALDRAVVLFGQGIGMTNDAMQQRLSRIAADLGPDTNNSRVNMDSLYGRYQTRCKQLLENPDAIADEYLRR